MQSLCVLGRQPMLGLAELERLYGAAKVRLAGSSTAVLDLPTEQVDFKRLGGSIKLCKVLTVLDTTEWPAVVDYLVENVVPHARMLPTGKLKLGLSSLGLTVTANELKTTGLTLKKALRTDGRSVRIIPNVTTELNTAQVIHNNLLGSLGWELVFVRDNQQTILAQTVTVQDISNYTLRDRGRPKRDSRIGMLPPKLAQIIINLALPQPQQVVLDPFCGTGVILQEALLMGYPAYGTDIDPRMVQYTQTNLDWLQKQLQVTPRFQVEIGDATSFKWPIIDVVASETYLGRPFTSLPDKATLAQTISDCNTILKKFLKHIATQCRSGTVLSLAIPAWQIHQGIFQYLPLLDQIEDMGYNRVSFQHVRDDELLYYRPNQIVARKLLVLSRK